jgi:uncharacterized protein
MKRYLSVPEVAARFEVTSQTVRDWIASGRLTAIQLTPRGRFRILSEAVDMFEQAARLGSDREQSASLSVDRELERVVAAIVAAVEPEAVYLFGSRARGDSQPDSDFDLAIVAPDGSDRRRLAMRAYERIATVDDRTIGVDLVVLTPRIMAAERDLMGSVARAVTREGVSVYASTAGA